MINLTCLPCKDLFAPVELISQRLEEMVLRGECRPLINGTLPHSVRIYIYNLFLYYSGVCCNRHSVLKLVSDMRNCYGMPCNRL